MNEPIFNKATKKTGDETAGLDAQDAWRILNSVLSKIGKKRLLNRFSGDIFTKIISVGGSRLFVAVLLQAGNRTSLFSLTS